MTITLEDVKQAYAMTGLKWTYGDFVGYVYGAYDADGKRVATPDCACAIGALGVAKHPELAEYATMEQPSKLIEAAKEWNGEPPIFYSGIINGNDSAPYETRPVAQNQMRVDIEEAVAYPYSRNPDDEEYAAYVRGWELGRSVRAWGRAQRGMD